MGAAMNVFVFAGPSLRDYDLPEDVATHVQFLPPAGQGDIARLALDHPGSIIVLIDGCFRNQLAPWHKEILFAMQRQQCRIIGAGSIGALRAVECQPWGAEPHGEIAAWYAAGTVMDDAEVALTHRTAKYEYAATTVPLVNVRASDCLTGDAIEQLASIPYDARTWKQIAITIGTDQFKELRANYIDQKRRDAVGAVCYALAPLSPRPAAPVALAQNLDNATLQFLLRNDLPTGTGRRQSDLVSKQERIDATHEMLLMDYAIACGVTPSNQSVRDTAAGMATRLSIDTSDDAEFTARLAAKGLTIADWWQRAELEATISAMVNWIDACEFGASSVPRAIQRAKFY